jgi:hypothetical protein
MLTRYARLAALAAALMATLGGGSLLAQDEPGDLPEIGELEETALREEERRRDSWNQWEFGLQTGRMVLTGSAFSDDAFTYGAQVLYRFRGTGKGRDGVPMDIQGRHGVEVSAIRYETDYFASHDIFTGAEAFPLFLAFGDATLSVPNGWFSMEASGSYSYNVVSANYIFTQLDRKGRLTKVRPYYLAGVGYAFGDADIRIRTRVRQVKCLDDPDDCNVFE